MELNPWSLVLDDPATVESMLEKGVPVCDPIDQPLCQSLIHSQMTEQHLVSLQMLLPFINIPQRPQMFCGGSNLQVEAAWMLLRHNIQNIILFVTGFRSIAEFPVVPDLLRYALQHGFDPSITLEDGRPLIATVKDLQLVIMLLASGGDPRMCDKDILVSVPDVGITRELVRLGVDPHARKISYFFYQFDPELVDLFVNECHLHSTVQDLERFLYYTLFSSDDTPIRLRCTQIVIDWFDRELIEWDDEPNGPGTGIREFWQRIASRRSDTEDHTAQQIENLMQHSIERSRTAALDRAKLASDLTIPVPPELLHLIASFSKKAH
jgi:hypothetical protein